MLICEILSPQKFNVYGISTSDFLWLNDQVLFSCSKDGKLIQQLFSDADRLTERTVRLPRQVIHYTHACTYVHTYFCMYLYWPNADINSFIDVRMCVHIVHMISISWVTVVLNFQGAHVAVFLQIGLVDVSRKYFSQIKDAL